MIISEIFCVINIILAGVFYLRDNTHQMIFYGLFAILNLLVIIGRM